MAAEGTDERRAVREVGTRRGRGPWRLSGHIDRKVAEDPLFNASFGRTRRLRNLVVRPVAALGWRQAAALRRDGSALHAVRGGDLELHLALAVELAVAVRLRGLELLVGHLVDLRRAHVLPHQGDLERNLVLDAYVVRRVVAGRVACGEHRRELVEGDLAVRLRVVALG